MGIEEVSVAPSDMITARYARAAAKHHLINHELAVVFPHCSVRHGVAWVRAVRRAGPFPYISEQLQIPATTGRKRTQISVVAKIAANRGNLCRRSFPFRL